MLARTVGVVIPADEARPWIEAACAAVIERGGSIAEDAPGSCCPLGACALVFNANAVRRPTASYAQYEFAIDLVAAMEFAAGFDGEESYDKLTEWHALGREFRERYCGGET